MGIFYGVLGISGRLGGSSPAGCRRGHGSTPAAARQEVFAAGRGGEDRLGGGRSRAGVGADEFRPASRADRTRGQLICMRVPGLASGPCRSTFVTPMSAHSGRSVGGPSGLSEGGSGSY